MIEGAPPGQKRSTETNVINEIIERKPDGTAGLKLDNPKFEEAKLSFKGHVDKKSVVAKPWIKAEAEWGGRLTQGLTQAELDPG
eukprot:3541423-Pyramimonas_sp.AAC.1